VETEFCKKPVSEEEKEEKYKAALDLIKKPGN